MEKKVKVRILLKKLVFYFTIVTGIFLLLIIVIDSYNSKNDIKRIETESFLTYGNVEKLVRRASNYRRLSSEKDIVYFYFIKNDTVFHKIVDLPNGEIDRLKIRLNDSFETRVVKSDVNIFEIDFEKYKDTLIVKNHHQIQIYNTLIHQNIIK